MDLLERVASVEGGHYEGDHCIYSNLICNPSCNGNHWAKIKFCFCFGWKKRAGKVLKTRKEIYLAL